MKLITKKNKYIYTQSIYFIILFFVKKRLEAKGKGKKQTIVTNK